METNTYYKIAPNVWGAKCPQQYAKGETIAVENKYGKETEHIVHNLFTVLRDGTYLYSITRADGLTAQDFARKRAERIEGWQTSAEAKSRKYWEASNEGREFLALGEPIKVGHHSEKRHRALIERNFSRMEKAVEASKAAELYEAKADYWRDKAEKINLSMPESIEYFEFLVEEAENKHAFLKANPDKREHAFSLTYANKAVKEAKQNLELARKLWA